MKDYEDFNEDDFFKDENLEDNELTDFDLIEKYYKKKKIIKFSILGAVGILLMSFVIITILALALEDPAKKYIVQNDFDNFDPSDYYP